MNKSIIKFLFLSIVLSFGIKLNAQENVNKKYPYATLDKKPKFANCIDIHCLNKRIGREVSFLIKNDDELTKLIPDNSRLSIIFEISKDGIVQNFFLKKGYEVLKEKIENTFNKEIVLNPGKVDGFNVNTMMSLTLRINFSENKTGKDDKVWLVEMRRKDAKDALASNTINQTVKIDNNVEKEYSNTTNQNNASRIDNIKTNQGLTSFDKKIIGKWGTKKKGRFSNLPETTLNIVIKGNSIIIHSEWNYYAKPSIREPMTGMRINGNQFELGDGRIVMLNDDLNILYIKGQFGGEQFYRY